ncbi:hypothetical protein ACFSTC_37200 [Nonomuraea ferruginea]
MDDHLLGWLRTLDEDRLARVLTHRPDALAAPWPRRLDTLAQRLSNGFAVMEALRVLPLPCLQLAEACLVLTRPTAERLAGFLGAPRAEVDRWLDHLYDHALACPSADGEIHLAEAVTRYWSAPLGLGEPLDHYLNSWTISGDTLRTLAQQPGPALPRRQAPHGRAGGRGAGRRRPHGRAAAPRPRRSRRAARRVRLARPRTRSRRRQVRHPPARPRSGRPTTACSTGRAGTSPRCPARWRSAGAAPATIRRSRRGRPRWPRSRSTPRRSTT